MNETRVVAINDADRTLGVENGDGDTFVFCFPTRVGHDSLLVDNPVWSSGVTPVDGIATVYISIARVVAEGEAARQGWIDT